MQSHYADRRRDGEAGSWRDAGSEFEGKLVPTTSAGTDTAEILVVGAEGERSHRHADWLNEEYVTRTTISDETVSRHVQELEPAVVLIDRQATPDSDGNVFRAIDRTSRRCQVVVLTDVKGERGSADDCLCDPVGRDELLDAVETARRVAAYDRAVDELLSLTVRRRELREQPGDQRVDRHRELGRVSRRIETLHECIDDELSGIESRYVALTNRGRERPRHEGQRSEERA